MLLRLHRNGNRLLLHHGQRALYFVELYSVPMLNCAARAAGHALRPAPHFFILRCMVGGDRASRKVWSAVLGLGMFALGSTFASSANAASPNITNQTWSCAVRKLESAYAVQVTATERTSFNPRSGAAVVTLIDIPPIPNLPRSKAIQVDIENTSGGFRVDGSRCHRASRAVVFSAHGLAAGPPGSANERCESASHVFVRARVALLGSTPISARVAIRNGDAKAAPLAYVMWAPERVRGWFKSDCVSVGP